MLLTLMLTSKGVAGVPRASLVILAGTLASYGLPLEGITLILGVDELMDMARTMTNVIGNCLATVVVAKWEGEFVEAIDDQDLAVARGEIWLGVSSTGRSAASASPRTSSTPWPLTAVTSNCRRSYRTVSPTTGRPAEQRQHQAADAVHFLVLELEIELPARARRGAWCRHAQPARRVAMTCGGPAGPRRSRRRPPRTDPRG